VAQVEGEAIVELRVESVVLGGGRSKVWTEPEMLEACRREFEGITERYLAG
jgi:hypothetical protein